MHRSLMLCAAGGLMAASFLAASPAQAAYRIVKWPITNFCQIWDFSLPDRPFPPNYVMMSPPLPSFGAAMHVKDRLIRRHACFF